jgi:DNA/RNA endonuclease YhcR with UshA esterase domain
MEEATLRKLAALCTVVGLVLLYYASIQIQGCADIDSITIDDVGKGFRACGTITAKTVSNNHIFFDVQDDTGSIKFVIFNTTALKLKETGISPYTLKEGTDIRVTGVADEYPKGTGKLELIYRGGSIEIY